MEVTCCTQRPFVPQGDNRVGARKGAEKKGKVNSDQRIATRKRPFVRQGDKRVLWKLLVARRDPSFLRVTNGWVCAKARRMKSELFIELWVEITNS